MQDPHIPCETPPGIWRGTRVVIEQERRERIRGLLAAGCTQRETALRSGVSRRSVARIAHESRGLVCRPVGRPSKAQPYAHWIRSVLRRSPARTSANVLEAARDEGYAGSRSALYNVIRAIRAELQTPPRRVTGKSVHVGSGPTHEQVRSIGG